MDKMKFETTSLVDKNIDKIEQIFPGVVTEVKDADGTIRKAVDFEALKAELSKDIVEGRECYEFTWAGKNEAKYEAAKSIRKTLRPCKEESKNWDTTQNLYIEGDNLDVLKLLQESYLNKVKMIYIDPPYNTGNDFVYADDFRLKEKEYEDLLDLADEEGNRLIRNTDSNGRFHSDWCSMLYSRLKLARNLLAEDGVIFISIDDNEVANLKKICDELYGSENFIAQIIWERAYSPVNLKKHFSECHDYLLCYSKNKEITLCNGLPRSQEANERYSNPDNDPRGVWKSSDLSVGPIVQSKVYEIETPSGRKVLPPNGYCWRLDKDTFQKYLKDHRIWFGESGNNVPSIKRFLSEVKQGMTPMTIWKYTEVGHSQDAAQKLKQLFDGKAVFDYPKSVELLKRCCLLYSDQTSIILDFFSGSATTAHAVMQLNAEDGGNRKFIMVQLPEKCDENSEAKRAGFDNICEIGKERIRRAGEKIKQEYGEKAENLDIGFRVFKLDSTNMKDVYYTPAELTQDLLAKTESNLKDDRTDMDLLYGCLLDWGLELSMPHETKQIDGVAVHYVNQTDLIACFNTDVSEAVIRKIAADKPLRVVFRDSCFKNVSDKTNINELFKAISPETQIKVI